MKFGPQHWQKLNPVPNMFANVNDCVKTYKTEKQHLKGFFIRNHRKSFSHAAKAF